MTQNGVVIAILPNGKVQVSVQRTSSCGGNCASCGECMNNSELTATVVNRCCAKVGDRVTLRSQTGALRGTAAMVYLLPLVTFFVGYGVSAAFGAKEGVSILISVLCLLLGCGIVTRLKRKRKKDISYEIISINQ